MASVSYDVLVEILKWLIEPEQDEVSKLETPWPFRALDDVPPLRSSRAQTHLRACCLVCRWWRIVAQPILQEHLCWRSSAGKMAVANLLKIDKVASKVTSLEAGKTCCELCALGEHRSCSISIETVVTILTTCPRLTRLVVNNWSGLHVAPSIPSIPIRTFSRLTILRIGTSNFHDRIPLRTFCLILQVMPALHTLSIGDISNTSSDAIDDIPYPPCQLRSLVVSDARAVDFQSYEWLLHNSGDSLKILHTYCVPPDAVASLLRALPHVGPSLREFHCIGCWDSQIVLSVSQHCHKLEALACCNGPNILGDLANAACAKTLQRFTATKVALVESPVLLGDGEYLMGNFSDVVLEFWSSGELTAMQQAVQRRVLPQLKEWRLQTWAKERIVAVSKDELITLKNECDKHGVIFEFARYDEVITGH
jgi:hypothetical protein